MIYDRSNTPVDPGVLDQMMKRLSQSGPDGQNNWFLGPVAMGHLHFWTTPEEVGEKQPLKLANMPYTIVMDGRLDNRPDIIRRLNLHSVEISHLSDAALILHAYSRWSTDCFKDLIGEFAVVIWDPQVGELVCARDALGDRTLFYTLDTNRILVASEPGALAGIRGDDPEMDEVGAAHYFALKASKDGRTLFKGISELLPAQVLAVSLSGERRWQYWQANLSSKIRYRSDEEYAEQFRLLLEQSVHCRLRSSTPIGILMSGGLDSTSVACLAARMLEPVPLTTISYVFDELRDCDERQYINAVQTQWGTKSIQIPCDDLWPLKDWSNWPKNPNQPEGNLYRLVKERAYARTNQEGLRVLLTGGFGDHLYSGAENWLADLIVDGRLLEARRELFFYIRSYGLRWTLEAGYMQQVAKRFIRMIPGGKLIHGRRTAPAWLTAYAADLLQGSENRTHKGSNHHANLIGNWSALDSSSEIFNANRYALELRHPYRDRRLVEFVLALPSNQLYRRGLYKHILRNAMKGLLPEMIRTRPQPTSLISLYFRGLEREKAVLQACFQKPGADWGSFVDEKWISTRWDGIPEKDGAEALIPWLCLAFEVWNRNQFNPDSNL